MASTLTFLVLQRQQKINQVRDYLHNETKLDSSQPVGIIGFSCISVEVFVYACTQNQWAMDLHLTGTE